MTFDNHVTVKTYSFATPCKIIFGGVPTSVAIPPELEAYATPSANTLLNRLISADFLFTSFLKRKRICISNFRCVVNNAKYSNIPKTQVRFKGLFNSEAYFNGTLYVLTYT